jgi:LCP family protein required for cell wall assembly
MAGFMSTAMDIAGPLLSLAGAASGNALNEGSDGRLTILLLGSDTRGGGVGRTDTVMVMSIKNGEVTAASIPRDTARIPNPYAPGTTYSPRVNAILKSLVRQYGQTVGFQRFEYTLEQLLGVQIDYYALVTFDGFERLVDEVDPIVINNPQNIRDTKFQDDPNKLKGVYFPPSSTYTLNALPDGPLCNGLWRTASNPAAYACHRALPFVRSRKGAGNSDFRRAARQQTFVIATSKAVSTGELSDVVGRANYEDTLKHLITNIPVSMATASEMYNLLHTAHFGNHVVFAPTTYSTHIPGGTAYQLKIPAVRAWIAANMH